MDTLLGDLCTFMVLSCSFLLTIRNVSNKSFRENQKIHFVFSNPPPPPENLAVYEIGWKNFVEPGKPQMAIWRTRSACCIPKAATTHPECVILIVFPLQQWLYERASMVRYT